MKLQRIELIIATAILIFAWVIIYGNRPEYLVEHMADRIVWAQMGYAAILYFSFVAVSQWIVPHYFRARRIEMGITLTLLLFFLIWFSLTFVLQQMRDSANYWGNLYDSQSMGITCLLIFLCSIYEIGKYSLITWTNYQSPLKTTIVREVLVVLGVGGLLFFLLVLLNGKLAVLWMISIPYAYALYAVATYVLIPAVERRKESYMVFLLKAAPVSFLLYIPFGLLYMINAHAAGVIFFIIWFCISAIVLPLSYFLFQQRKERIAELVGLKVELGNTTAGLNFLRMQINPHFLFNALNTLYGTALQENAERTASGVQKLGDMMRFMLHENNQDKILLPREIDYLKNYIELQELRTALSPQIEVTYRIDEPNAGLYISPMLLIPFVENAFKHGISLQEKSWIRISLRTKGDKLHFDVYNSIHRKSADDPEFRESGVGLENVRQRLQLLYAKRHELTVRETGQDYFVHLTLEL